jgi:hypothetical protein
MKFYEVAEAIEEAKVTFRAADANSTSLVRILVGRLRHVNDNYALGNLKRELRTFDLRRERWSKK